ncbi:hypothetical protein PFISCL1PPCAC_21995, partial [Pristionchus fissidentatus]
AVAMTVGYMKIAATAKLGTFLRLLLRWRGSVWKGVWRELAAWLFIYNWISLLYRFYLRDTPNGDRFEQLVIYTDLLMSHARTALIFVLGFYVSHVAGRWWNVFMEIPWPDTIALSIAAFLHSRPGKEKNDRDTRVNIMRYIVVSYVLVFRDVCERIRMRFPTLKHLTPGLMTEVELRMLEKCDDEFSIRMWMPIEWSLNLLKKCKDRRQISDVHFVYLTKEILKFRDRLQNIKSFDWINVPLVYSQVVSLSTSVYFIMCLIARQYIAIEHTDIRWQVDYLLPFFTMGEFICLVGWLKCAQVMINPFGQDDDDFEVDTLIERNLAVSMTMVDDLYDKAPPLARIDIKQLPTMLDPNKKNPMIGSAVPIKMQANDMKMVDPNKEKWIKTGAQAVNDLSSNMENSETTMEAGTKPGLQVSNPPSEDKTRSGEDTSYKKLLAGSPTGKVHQNSQEDQSTKDENAKRQMETDDIMKKVLEKLIHEKHVMVLPVEYFENPDGMLDKTQANSPSKTSLPSSNASKMEKMKSFKWSGEAMAMREDKTPDSLSASRPRALSLERTQMSTRTTKNTPAHSMADRTLLMDTPKRTPEGINVTPAASQQRKTSTPQKAAQTAISKAKFDDGLNQLLEKLRAKDAKHQQQQRHASKSTDSQWKETPGKSPGRARKSKGSAPPTPKKAKSREKAEVTEGRTVNSKDPINSKEATQAKTSSKDPLSKEPV